jgi:hypothetical protein
MCILLRCVIALLVPFRIHVRTDLNCSHLLDDSWQQWPWWWCEWWSLGDWGMWWGSQVKCSLWSGNVMSALRGAVSGVHVVRWSVAVQLVRMCWGQVSQVSLSQRRWAGGGQAVGRPWAGGEQAVGRLSRLCSLSRRCLERLEHMLTAWHATCSPVCKPRLVEFSTETSGVW